MDFFWIVNTVAILATLFTIYWFWIRQILAETPQFSNLIASHDSWVDAIKVKFAGIKQQFVGALIVAASAVVTMYDSIVPSLTGVDITPLTANIPQWAIPMIAISVTVLLNWLRTLSDRRQAEQTAAVLKVPTIDVPDEPAVAVEKTLKKKPKVKVRA